MSVLRFVAELVWPRRECPVQPASITYWPGED